MTPDPHRIASLDALLALYGEVNPNSLRKETTALTPGYRRWIEASPFLAVATSGPGGLDCSPRGDAAGRLFAVDDDCTILIPDRRGNNRLDTLRNLIADPRIGLLFFVPGVPECVRVNGTAAITVDPSLRSRFAVDGHLPATVVVVSIEAVYFQCARAIMRSRLWEPDTRVDPATLPTAGEMTSSGAAAYAARGGEGDFDASAYDGALRDRQRATLY